MGYQLDLTRRTITEDDIADNQATIRAVLFQRYQAIWDWCEPHVAGVADRPDQRAVALGLKVSQELGHLFRIDVDVQPAVPDDDVTPRLRYRAAIDAGIRELEARQ